MARIIAKQLYSSDSQISFSVRVVDKVSTTNHKVTMVKEFYKELKTEKSPEFVVEKSFEFLLAREPKEQIMPEFDLLVISRFFPEYQEELKNLLEK